MHTMTEAEKAERAKQKAMHKNVRDALAVARKRGGAHHRVMLLVWGFVRGFNFRRIEPRHHTQPIDYPASTRFHKPPSYLQADGKLFFQHNIPSSLLLAEAIEVYCPDLKLAGQATDLLDSPASYGRTEAIVRAWLSEPPIPKPARAPKPPFVRRHKVNMHSFREAALRAADGRPFEMHAEPAVAVPEE